MENGFFAILTNSALLGLCRRELHYLLPLLLAVLFGGLVGLERQARGRPAGLRTNILVCLGSATIIVAFQKLSTQTAVGAESILRMDPARAAAGVITGIGFLGAGTIVKSENFVRGLTTAASIWVVSTIGITLGLGEYAIAIAVTFLVMVALYFLHRFKIKSDRYFTLTLKWRGSFALLEETETLLKSRSVRIRRRRVTRQPGSGRCQVTLDLGIAAKTREIYPILYDLQEDHRFEEIIWY